MVKTVERVLAVDSGNRGFGFVVMEGPRKLLDWGLKISRSNHHERILLKDKELIGHYGPDWVVCEDPGYLEIRRGPRARAFIAEVQKLCLDMDVKCVKISKKMV